MSASPPPLISPTVILNKTHDTGLEIKCALPPGSAALLVTHNNKIVLDWGKTKEKFWVHSIRKSFLSALTGVALCEGRLQLETPLEEYSFLPDKLNGPESNATLHDLILSRSGIYLPAAAADRELPPRGSHLPGEAWFYNNWGFNVVQLVLEQNYECDIFSLFSEKIAVPLGMKNFIPNEDGSYVGSNEHALKAGFFRMDSFDLASFGQLYLNNGQVRQRQILESDWITKSIRPVSKTDLGNGYGYMWWISANGISIPGMTSYYPDLYYGWGWAGHYIVVVPSLNITIVHRSDTNDVSRTTHVSHEEFGQVTDEILHFVKEDNQALQRTDDNAGH